MCPATWLLLLLATTGLVHARNRSPLLDDETTKMRNKSAECIFGKQVRELGSVWIPDLGPPIGVLYCMRCECVKIQRKRRIVAKVQCHNIKSECPEPTCDEPILLPGRCCKTCNGDLMHPDIVPDIVPQSTSDEEERGTKHYAALLTGRSSLSLGPDADLGDAASTTSSSDGNGNGVVAVGRFTFHRRSLFYSLYVSDKAARPVSLQFLDGGHDAAILEELRLSAGGGRAASAYQNATRKICGCWRSLPREYRRLLRQERLWAALVWGGGGGGEGGLVLSGRLARHPSPGAELFSSLLEPAPEAGTALAGAGGTAAVYSALGVSPSVHVAVIFNGLFDGREGAEELPVEITLAVDDSKRPRAIIQENVYVRKPSYELNMVEISSPVTPGDLRQLTRGRLVISVASTTNSSLRLTGGVGPKFTCELFQTTLQSGPSERVNPHGTSGLAWMYLNGEGSLVYNVQVDNLRKEPAQLTLIDTSTRRRTELEDLTPYFVNGWANGTIDKLSPKVLEPLYAGNLAVNIATDTDNSFISGRLNAKLVADAKDAPAPALLKRENYTLPPSAVGMAWLLVDDDCHMFYDVSLSGLGPSDRRYSLVMELLPIIAPGAPVITKLLDDFQGNQADGSPLESLTKEQLNRLVNGVCFLKVKDRDTRITLLSAQVTEVQIPAPCRPRAISDNNVPHLWNDYPDGGATGDCFHEGVFYQDESQWTSSSDPCVMCYCQNGNAHCYRTSCPDPACPHGHAAPPPPDECCPACAQPPPEDPDARPPSRCIFNGRAYSPGSRFHPFLIPGGFDACTECRCDAAYREIRCQRRAEGGPGGCGGGRADAEEPPAADDPVTNMIGTGGGVGGRSKEVPVTTAREVLARGGCVNLNDPRRPYENGTSYHPVIESLGVYKCVTCKCLDGNQTCKRQHCDRVACERMLRAKKSGQTAAPDDFCCSFKECRKFRPRRNRTIK